MKAYANLNCKTLDPNTIAKIIARCKELGYRVIVNKTMNSIRSLTIFNPEYVSKLNNHFNLN